MAVWLNLVWKPPLILLPLMDLYEGNTRIVELSYSSHHLDKVILLNRSFFSVWSLGGGWFIFYAFLLVIIRHLSGPASSLIHDEVPTKHTGLVRAAWLVMDWVGRPGWADCAVWASKVEQVVTGKNGQYTPHLPQWTRFTLLRLIQGCGISSTSGMT